MVESYPLSMLSIGSTAIIHSSNSSGAMRRRLMDLGFSTGAKVKCIQIAPSGDPIAYSIRGTVIALRNETAKNILVRNEYIDISVIDKPLKTNNKSLNLVPLSLPDEPVSGLEEGD